MCQSLTDKCKWGYCVHVCLFVCIHVTVYAVVEAGFNIMYFPMGTGVAADLLKEILVG
jgi:hypothetical protein